MVVSLNVGGKKFVTTLQTLGARGENMLTRVARTNVGVTRDSKGNILIDRSGRLFEYVLEYLRTGKLVMPPKNAHLRKAVEEELRFFAIRGLAGEVSDTVLEEMVAAAKEDKVANLLGKYPTAVEQMIRTILGDLYSRAEGGLLTHGYGGVVFLCGTRPPNFNQQSFYSNSHGYGHGQRSGRNQLDELWQVLLSELVKAFSLQEVKQQKNAFEQLRRHHALSQLSCILPKSNGRQEQSEILLTLQTVSGISYEDFGPLCSNIVSHLAADYDLSVGVCDRTRNPMYDHFGYGSHPVTNTSNQK